jgi:hypothetical protein
MQQLAGPYDIMRCQFLHVPQSVFATPDVVRTRAARRRPGGEQERVGYGVTLSCATKKVFMDGVRMYFTAALPASTSRS